MRGPARIIPCLLVAFFVSAPILHADRAPANDKTAQDPVERAFREEAVPVLEEAVAALLAGQRYRDVISAKSLVESMLRGMVADLGDPFAAVAVSDAPQGAGSGSGRSTELGLILDHDRYDRLVVASVIPGSPAHGAGIVPGDLLLRVGDRNVSGFSAWEALPLLRGAVSSVRLTVSRSGVPREITVDAGDYAISTVSLRIGDMEGDRWIERDTGSVAWLAVHAFVAPLTLDEWSRAVSTIWSSRTVRTIVLDLRDNGGGDNSCLRALGDFFSGGEHLVSFDALVGEEGWTQAVHNHFVPRARLLSYPVAVLVNGQTASLAEIFAASIAEGRNAPVIGETTYGKGTTQTWVTVGDRYALRLTLGAWRTPAGRSVDGTGIVPDVEVPADSPDELLAAAVREVDRLRNTR